MNKISEMRQKVRRDGHVVLNEEDYNELQKEWILRTMEYQAAMVMATTFYRWWHNHSGTNTEQGFEDWWNEQNTP